MTDKFDIFKEESNSNVYIREQVKNTSEFLLNSMIEKYSELKKYKYHDFTYDYKKVQEIAKQNADKLKHSTIAYSSDEENSDLLCFLLEINKVALVCETYDFNNTSRYSIHYNNIEDVRTLFEGKKNYDIGVYNLIETPSGIVLQDCNVKETREIILKNDFQSSILESMKSFFEKEKTYKENNMMFKRGLLLYGPPGNGKTSLIKNIISDNKNAYVIIIDCSKGFSSLILSFLRTQTKDYKKIIIFEDIDMLDSVFFNSIRNFMDGIDGLENCYYIATCNDTTKVDRALLDRPGRFDEYILIDNPDEELRKKLLKLYFNDYEFSEEELNKFNKLTEGFCGSHFKELKIKTVLYDYSIEEAIKKIKEQSIALKDFNKNPEYFG